MREARSTWAPRRLDTTDSATRYLVALRERRGGALRSKTESAETGVVQFAIALRQGVASVTWSYVIKLAKNLVFEVAFGRPERGEHVVSIGDRIRCTRHREEIWGRWTSW